MRFECIDPNSSTFACILKACGHAGAAQIGQEVHDETVKQGLLEHDAVLGTALVDMYAKCALLLKAQEIFDMLKARNSVSWNALMAGYAQHGNGEEVFNCYGKMLAENFRPEASTYICILKACGCTRAAEMGQAIPDEIVKIGLLEKDMNIGNALVDMYAKCGLITKALEVFEKLPVRDRISWNVLTTGLVQHGQGEEALNFFEKMQSEGVLPNAIIYVCMMQACGIAGAMHKGQELHVQIAREGLIESDIVVATALIDMYVKCGSLYKAQAVFDALPSKTLVPWNALLAGYACFGEDGNVFDGVGRLISKGLKPDLVTFNIVITVCSHAGLVDEGQVYFEIMIREHGIFLTLEQYACMVDLFGRTGQMDKAAAMIKRMPLCANLTIWHALLSSCRKWYNLELGRLAFENAVQLHERDAAAYVYMFNLYVDAGKQEDAKRIEVLGVGKTSMQRFRGIE